MENHNSDKEWGYLLDCGVTLRGRRNMKECVYLVSTSDNILDSFAVFIDEESAREQFKKGIESGILKIIKVVEL